MKIPNITTQGLFIGFAAFLTLLFVALLEVHIYYPQVKTYFDNTRTFNAQNLAARSRGYILETVDLISRPSSYNYQTKEKIEETLDIAYGLLNMELYIRNYQCTKPALQEIDHLFTLLEKGSAPDINKYIQTAMPIIQCTETIQSGANQVRANLANRMLDDITNQLKLTVYGVGLFLIICIVFLSINFRQKRVIKRNKMETNRWIQNALEDALTGTKNRRAFDIDIKNYADKGNIYSLLMCDIDYFKQYNDRYGHPGGDKILKLVADAIKQTLRENDHLYRYGGEELIIILDETDKHQAEAIGHRILKNVRELACPHLDSEYKIVTISIGCATHHETKFNSRDLIKLADKRLYAAKKAGRNCIVSSV